MDSRRELGAASLQGVLRELSVPAQDYITSQLRADHSLGSFRLTCKEIADFVASTVRELNLELAPVHKELVEGRHPPPALPYCRALHLQLRAIAGWDAATNYAVLRLFARSLPAFMVAQEGGGIIHLVVARIDPEFQSAHAAVAALILGLPGLRSVDLNGFWKVYPPAEALHLQVLYDAVATLPYLTSLTAPSLQAADYLAFASAAANCHLWHLELTGTPGSVFTPATARSIAHFEQLRYLSISCCEMGAVDDGKGTDEGGGGDDDGDGGGLSFLLENLPRRLQKLDLPCIKLELGRGGVITSAEVRDFWDAAAATADGGGSRGGGLWSWTWAAQLLRCRGLRCGRRLARLRFSDVYVGAKPPAVSAALRQLLSRTEVVEVCQVTVEPNATEGTLMATLEVLGRWPSTFCVIFLVEEDDFSLGDLPVPWAQEPFRCAAAPPGLGGGGGSSGPLNLAESSSSQQHEKKKKLQQRRRRRGLLPAGGGGRGAAREVSGTGAEEADDDDDEEAEEALLQDTLSRFVADVCPAAVAATAGTRADEVAAESPAAVGERGGDDGDEESGSDDGEDGGTATDNNGGGDDDDDDEGDTDIDVSSEDGAAAGRCSGSGDEADDAIEGDDHIDGGTCGVSSAEVVLLYGPFFANLLQTRKAARGNTSASSSLRQVWHKQREKQNRTLRDFMQRLWGRTVARSRRRGYLAVGEDEWCGIDGVSYLLLREQCVVLVCFPHRLLAGLFVSTVATESGLAVAVRPGQRPVHAVLVRDEQYGGCEDEHPWRSPLGVIKRLMERVVCEHWEEVCSRTETVLAAAAAGATAARGRGGFRAHAGAPSAAAAAAAAKAALVPQLSSFVRLGRRLTRLLEGEEQLDP